MNLKPFNLEEALKNPNRVVTRDGIKVEQLNKFEVNTRFSLFAVFKGSVESFGIDGKWCYDDTSRDLFLLPETKTVWVVVIINPFNLDISYTFNSEEEANNFINIKYYKYYSKPPKIEIEI